MSLRPQLSEPVRCFRGRLVPVTLLALAPKCALCLLAYVGIPTALDLNGPEICGATGEDRSWTLVLPLLGVALTTVVVFARRKQMWKRRPVHSPGNTSSSSTSKVRPDSAGTLPDWMLP